jgi:NAD(P)-dependent dehydrogenase (short-subunit alcohol dehydrogenase family)
MLTHDTPESVLRQVEELIPLGRLAEPIEVARMIAWLVSDDNSYATGATFDVNGGLEMP